MATTLKIYSSRMLSSSSLPGPSAAQHGPPRDPARIASAFLCATRKELARLCVWAIFVGMMLQGDATERLVNAE
jgi:hypothetical protein